MEREDEIRQAAYELWEKEGCPQGRDCEHWYLAEVMWEEKNGKAFSEKSQTGSKEATKRKTKVAAARKKSTKT
jgi:hypothetical protein